MKIVTIVQARMGSSRLPGKVMLDLGGKTVLGRVMDRLGRAKLTGELVVATTDASVDDEIVTESRRAGVKVFRGDEKDVLDRYYRAAQHFRAEAVVRITSDCPLIDPEISDKTIQMFLENRPDYASNALQRTYPRGLDTEVFTMECLARTWKLAQKSYQRSHVTAYIYENPGQFHLLPVTGDTDYSWQRWTVDTTDDLKFIRAIYERVEDADNFGWREVLTIVESEPELLELNRHVMQKSLHEG
jgi:spore coat polysaccharide biosynthesis protein SpsF